MTADATTTADTDSTTEVLASVDPSPNGDEFIIADISRDDAWLSMPAAMAPSLREWR